MRGREKLYLALNLLLLTFCSIGIAQFAAFFPLYVGELGIRQELVAPIFSVFMVASLVMAMASGPLANRYSRLRVLTFAVGCVDPGVDASNPVDEKSSSSVAVGRSMTDTDEEIGRMR